MNLKLETYKPRAPVQMDNFGTSYGFVVGKDGCTDILALQGMGVLIEIVPSGKVEVEGKFVDRPPIHLLFFPDGSYAKLAPQQVTQ